MADFDIHTMVKSEPAGGQGPGALNKAGLVEKLRAIMIKDQAVVAKAKAA